MSTTETTINEKPILFSTQMVQAILDGRKTQTRRVMNLNEYDDHYLDGCEAYRYPIDLNELGLECPYGQPGDELWVRETWRPIGWDCENPYYKIEYKTSDEVAIHDQLYPPENPKDLDLHLSLYDELTEKNCPKNEAGNFPTEEIKKRLAWKPSIHMPRGASRIQLTVTDIRVERVKNISFKDAEAEGIKKLAEPDTWKCYGSDCKACSSAIESFHSLWDSINADRGYGWEVNPWCWCVSFEVQNIKQ